MQKLRLPTSHDYHSLSTIETKNVAEPTRPPPIRSRLTSSRAVGPVEERRHAYDGSDAEPRHPTGASLAPFLVGSGFTPKLGRDSDATERPASLDPRPSLSPPSVTNMSDSIARWREGVVPFSTSEHAPDWSLNGFQKASSALPVCRPSKPVARKVSVTGEGIRPESMMPQDRKPNDATRLAPTRPTEAESERLSWPISPPPSLSPTRSREANAFEAVGNLSPCSLYDADKNSVERTPAQAPSSPDPLDDARFDRFEQRYPPPSPLPQLDSFHRGLAESAPSMSFGVATAKSRSLPSFPEAPSKTRRRCDTSSARPSRLGAYPVPELTAEEQAARRALRKSGWSPEHHLPLHATKAGLRRQAWLERQAVRCLPQLSGSPAWLMSRWLRAVRSGTGSLAGAAFVARRRRACRRPARAAPTSGCTGAESAKRVAPRDLDRGHARPWLVLPALVASPQ